MVLYGWKIKIDSEFENWLYGWFSEKCHVWVSRNSQDFLGDTFIETNSIQNRDFIAWSMVLHRQSFKIDF